MLKISGLQPPPLISVLLPMFLRVKINIIKLSPKLFLYSLFFLKAYRSQVKLFNEGKN